VVPKSGHRVVTEIPGRGRTDRQRLYARSEPQSLLVDRLWHDVEEPGDLVRSERGFPFGDHPQLDIGRMVNLGVLGDRAGGADP
jgi:hypothetical protein